MIKIISIWSLLTKICIIINIWYIFKKGTTHYIELYKNKKIKIDSYLDLDLLEIIIIIINNIKGLQIILFLILISVNPFIVIPIYILTIFKILSILVFKIKKKDSFENAMRTYSKISDYRRFVELVSLIIKMINIITTQLSFIIIKNIKNKRKIELKNIIKRIAFVNILGISQLILIICIYMTIELSKIKINKKKKMKIRYVIFIKDSLKLIINSLFLEVYVKLQNTD